MRFNSRGDLFATDQEGATWVPNGNPFDELLHIQKGRHYGFPRAAPAVYVPNVIDEPSTFDYSPQHQMYVRLEFQRAGAERAARLSVRTAWAEDAIVTGYSRGKLFRTKLALTPAGYVASTNLLACLNMLTVDACISPDGETRCRLPQRWARLGQRPHRQRQAVQDQRTATPSIRSLSPYGRQGRAKCVLNSIGLCRPACCTMCSRRRSSSAGRYVRAGDRFESVCGPATRPCKAQKLTPRFDVPVRSAQLTPDGRTLVLATDPISQADSLCTDTAG